MSKGLEAKNRLVNKCSEYLTLSIDHQVAEDFLTIEKELKQAEENKEMLNVFKNALTIERKPINNIHAFKKDFVGGLASEIIEIKQNELDIKLRSNLREWVLKNAFPKELKALEIIKNKGVNARYLIYIISYQGLDYEEYKESFEEYSDLLLTKEEYDLLKEVLNNG